MSAEKDNTRKLLERIMEGLEAIEVSDDCDPPCRVSGLGEVMDLVSNMIRDCIP